MDIEEQYDKIYRFCYLRVRHRETAEDITQETFLRYLEHPQYHSLDKTLQLLYTIIYITYVIIQRHGGSVNRKVKKGMKKAENSADGTTKQRREKPAAGEGSQKEGVKDKTAQSSTDATA